MGKKSKGKNRKRRKKREDYEAYQYGPLRLERHGRYVAMSTRWKPGEYEKHINFIKSKRPELRTEINAKIQELLKIIEENDPFELLAIISHKNCFTDPEKYRESTHEGRECYVEYALSLITSHNKHGFGKHSTEESIQKFNVLITDIFKDLLWYYVTEVTETERDRDEDELRYLSMLRYLFIRGDSFPEHHLDLIKDLFKPHNAFLKRNFGLNIDEIIAGIQEIEAQVLRNVNSLIKSMLDLKEHHEIFKKFVDEKGVESFSSLDECMEQFRSLPEIQKRQQEIEQLQDTLGKIPFEITSNRTAPPVLIQLLTLEIGDNKNFLTFEKAPGWPTNDSIIYQRPLIKHDGKIYSFMPQLLFRNIGVILEDLIRQKDQEYFDKTYQGKRADYLERKALKYFEQLLPKAKIYGKLFYEAEESGQRKRLETDGLILYDNNLFILEGKAGTLSLSARRGSLERVKKDAASLIDSAYGQALRTKKYIETTENPWFEYENGSMALTIPNKNKIENVFLINVTLESLGHLSTRLNSLKRLNLIQGKEWPWSVFINDLRVIAEILESPSQFLEFLKRRIRANDFPQFNVSDELDFLMFYLREGLYFEEVNKKENFHFTPHAYTEPLDRYYDFLAGRVSSGEKPALRTSPEFKELIKNIESLSKEGFTTVTTTLLGLSGEAHKNITEGLNHIKELSVREGKLHDATFYFKGMSLGVTFFVGPNLSVTELNRMEDHCRLKMYQTRYENWIAIVIGSAGKITSPHDFLILRKRWEYDEQLEQKLRHFKKRKWEKTGMMGQKIGRNQPCPCGSGLKYKKCCGR